MGCWEREWKLLSYIGVIWGYRDTGKGNGNYYSILGLYGDSEVYSGKENASYYSIMGLYGDIWVMENQVQDMDNYKEAGVVEGCMLGLGHK